MKSPRVSRRRFIDDLMSAGLTAAQADIAFTSFVGTVAHAIRSDSNILLPGTLKLEARKRNPRVCKNNLRTAKGIPDSTYYGERTVYLARLPKGMRH